MQPVKQLARVLTDLADSEHYLFTLDDLQCVLPDQSRGAFKAMVSRAERDGLLRRVSRGLYLYPRVAAPGGGLLLYHAAARLRANQFNYISLESALSDVGIISQIPMNWVTLMSSGRSSVVQCGEYGHIEFVHTKKRPAAIADQLTYDTRCRLWRASVVLALKDMRATRRNMDLIDREALREFV